jgi:hypothetical protein
LVIRDDGLLGKSIHCPRCKSVLVLPVEPPSEGEPVLGVLARSVVVHDSTAVTRIDDGTLAQQVADLNQALPKAATGLSELDASDLASAINAYRAEELPHSTMHELTSIDPPSIQGQSSGIEASTVETTPTYPAALDWDSRATKQRRQILLIAMTGLAGLMLALAGLAAFIAIRSGKELSKTSSQIEPKMPDVLGPGEPTLPDAAETSKLMVDDAKKEASTKLDKLDDQTPDASKTKLTSNPAEEKSSAMSNSPSIDADGSDSTNKSSTNEQPAPNAESIAVVPQPSISDVSDIPSSPKDSISTDRPNDIPESMKRFLGIFDASKIPVLSDAITDEKVVDEVREKIDVESLYHPPAIELPLWEGAREKMMFSVSATNQPLDRLLIRLGQLTGVPIGWDLDTSRFASPEIIINVKSNREPLRKFLESILEEKKVSIVGDPDGTAILRGDPTWIRSKLPADWLLDDLCKDAAEWTRLLTKLFPQSMQRCRLEDKRIEWTEEATGIEKAELAVFLDQVRRGVGIKPTSSFATELIDPQAGWQAIDGRLKTKGTRIQLEPNSSACIFDEAARDVGLRMMFDWPSLYAHGFSFAASDTILVRGRTLSEIVRRTLEKHSLVAVIDNPQRIVLTTLPRQRRMWRTIVLKVDGDSTSEQLRERFRLLAPVSKDGRSTLTVEFIPSIPNQESVRLAAIRICPPNTFQIENFEIREALHLPAR